MMTLEAFVMVALATAAVLVAFTKLTCPTSTEDRRITWLPTSVEELRREEDAGSLSLHR